MKKQVLRKFSSLALFVISTVITGLCPAHSFAGTIVSGGLWVGSIEPDFYIHFRATQRRISKLAFTGVAACLTKDTGEVFNKQITISVGQTPFLSMRNGRSRGQFEVQSPLEQGTVLYDIRLAGKRGTAKITYWYDIELEACNLGPVRIPVRRSRAR